MPMVSLKRMKEIKSQEIEKKFLGFLHSRETHEVWKYNYEDIHGETFHVFFHALLWLLFKEGYIKITNKYISNDDIPYVFTISKSDVEVIQYILSLVDAKNAKLWFSFKRSFRKHYHIINEDLDSITNPAVLEWFNVRKA